MNTLKNFLFLKVLISKISATCPQGMTSTFSEALLNTGPKQPSNSFATSFKEGSRFYNTLVKLRTFQHNIFINKSIIFDSLFPFQDIVQYPNFGTVKLVVFATKL